MPASPWDNLIGQTVLGGEGFAARLAAGLKKTDPGRKRLARARRGSKWSNGLSRFVRRNGNGFGIGMERPGATWRCIWDGPYAASAWWS